MTMLEHPRTEDGKKLIPVNTKYVVCTTCDIWCQLRAEVDEEGKLSKIKQHDNPLFAKHICYKGAAAPDIHNHKERLKVPLKRVGARGEDKWEEISYEQAMDEIAVKLKKITDEYGPESMAVATSGWNTQVTSGMDRRFMNVLGSPNWTSGVSLCAGNTAAVNKMVYGWFPFPDLDNTDCVLLIGHNPRKHSWSPIFHMLNDARANGAKFIVVDPRKSTQASNCDLHLSIKAGTDTVLLFGMVNVIITENLYDKKFVEEWTLGFDELKDRVLNDFPLERCSEVTGLSIESIQEAARMYANAKSATIPWTPITDQQINSTSAIRLQCILRAITGNLDKPGGEIMFGFNPDYRSETEMGFHEAISQEQKDKQLGSDQTPAFTYKAQQKLSEATKKVWGYEYNDLVTGCYMATPPALFRAMAHGDPYPVKAFFAVGNNTLMSFSNQPLIYKALMNQELIVSHEIFMTPTSMLADYILPGDVYSERNHVADMWGWIGKLTLSQKAVEPPPEASSTFQFWTDLAHRFGFEEHFPWKNIEEVLDYRLEPSGKTFREFEEANWAVVQDIELQKYEKNDHGFATPSGKVEIWSSVLEELGFDPLPYYREGPESQLSDEYPYLISTGVREDPFFQTGQRNIDVLRRRMPSPLIYLHPVDAAREEMEEGDWVDVSSQWGSVAMKVSIRETMKEGHIRVPHGWWYPEMRENGGLMDGAFISSDASLTPDESEYIDAEQGIPHFHGFPGKIVKREAAPEGLSQMVLEG